MDTENWTLSSYKRRINRACCLHAVYPVTFPQTRRSSRSSASSPCEFILCYLDGYSICLYGSLSVIRLCLAVIACMISDISMGQNLTSHFFSAFYIVTCYIVLPLLLLYVHLHDQIQYSNCFIAGISPGKRSRQMTRDDFNYAPGSDYPMVPPSSISTHRLHHHRRGTAASISTHRHHHYTRGTAASNFIVHSRFCLLGHHLLIWILSCFIFNQVKPTRNMDKKLSLCHPKLPIGHQI